MSVRRQLIIVGSILLLIGVVDFATRIYVGRDSSLRTFRPPPAMHLPPVESAENVRQRLLGWLPTVAGSAAGAQNPADPNAWNFALLGIFSGRVGAVAVLSASLQPGTPGEKVRVSIGDTIHGWTVTGLGPRVVTLTQGSETRQLSLFKRGQPGQSGTAAGPG